jgi:DNA polymerase III delta prime subunit
MTPREATAPVLLELLVEQGLSEYATLATPAEDVPVLSLLRRTAQARAPDLAALPWPERRAALDAAWQRVDGPFRRLTTQLRLAQHELFLLGLAGGAESSHLIGLALAALQAPEPVSRPGIHLALDLWQQLFAVMGADALDLVSGRLCTSGLLIADGSGPLPQRHLRVRPELWRALRGGEADWPGCRRLEPPMDAPDAARLATLLTTSGADGLVLRGPPGSGRAALASGIARHLGCTPMQTPAELYQGDLAFGAACRAVGWLPVVRAPLGSGESLTLTRPDGLPLPAIVLAGAHGAIEGQQWLDATLEPPDVATRTQLWREALGDPNLAELLASSAVLFSGGIERVARAARGLAGECAVTAADVAEARRRLAPDALRMLAQPVPRRVRRDALVLPEALERDLHLLIARCRQRETIWQGIGPSLAAGATRGVRAFFAGESGTGKTLAASYVATALGAPLFRCDLGAVMNKYIGESEKNLGQLLDHAEAADVVLLFDEADALFGRRSDGAETGERYANMLTNFLLTRIENHNGIVILTANNKARIDPAFWRRLDVVMDFPLPGYEERLRLWESHLGARAPDEHVLHHLASYCDLAGGSIRNAVLSAAATVPPGVPIGSVALAAALAREYRKLGRRLPPDLALVPARAAGG